MKNTSSSLSRKQPKIIPYALGNPEDPVKWTHDVGIRFLQQVHTVRQAQEAIDLGVDALIAQ